MISVENGRGGLCDLFGSKMDFFWNLRFKSPKSVENRGGGAYAIWNPFSTLVMTEGIFAAALAGELNGSATFDKDGDDSLGYLDVHDDGYIRCFLSFEINLWNLHPINLIGPYQDDGFYDDAELYIEECICTYPMMNAGMIVMMITLPLGFQLYS